MKGSWEQTAAGQGLYVPVMVGLLLSVEDGPNPLLEASGFIAVKRPKVRPLLIGRFFSVMFSFHLCSWKCRGTYIEKDKSISVYEPCISFLLAQVKS